MSRKSYRQYTAEEISKTLHEQNIALEDAIKRREDLNKDISSIKKNIAFYESMDERQMKITW